MNSSWKFKLSLLVTLISLIAVNVRSSDAESSGEYLQKVMIELQELNVPSSTSIQDRLSMNLDHQHAGYQNDKGQSDAYRKPAVDNVHEQPQQNAHRGVQKPTPTLPVEYADTVHSASNNIVQYYAVRDPGVINYPKVKQQPEPLAFTRTELAALYKKALEKGSTLSLPSLTQALNAPGGVGNAPQAGSHLQLPLKYPMYNYYFFPLKSFASELQRDHQASAIVPAYAATGNVESTQKEVTNPLFVAIGTFISLALLFMMSVLFLPKIPHFELFNARVADDDLLRLTTFVTNAIDKSNVLEKFHHS